MKIKVVKKGETEGLPAPDKAGWYNTEVPENGLVIVFEAAESNNRGAFLAESVLREHGYISKDNDKNLADYAKHVEDTLITRIIHLLQRMKHEH